MTKTTDSRQIGLLVGGILQHYGIDNLQLEIDLSSAVKRYFDERYKSGDKAGIRERIMKDMEVAAANAKQKEQMEVRVMSAIGINASGERFSNMIDWLIKEEEEGKTIEGFKSWWDKQNEFKRPALWKISDRPALLHELWPSAFANGNQGGDKYQRALAQLDALNG